jgi:hypothetical protein
MILRDKLNIRNAKEAYVNCIRAAAVSNDILLNESLPFIVTISTDIVIILKRGTAIWLGI